MNNQYLSITTKEVEEWIRLNKKLTVPEISRQVERNVKSIYKHFKKVGYIPLSHVNRPKKVSDDQILKVYKKYTENKNLSFTSIALELNINKVNLRKRFVKLLLPIKSKYTVSHKLINDDFFSVIDNEIKAYLLGFFAADGHIENRTEECNTYCLKFSLAKKDIEVLNMYNKHVANNLCNIINLKNGLVMLSIHSKEIGESLLNLGYDNRKTYTNSTLPKIPDFMMPHFIRGFIDGDGSIMYNKQKRGSNRSLALCSYKKNILEEIISHFPPFIGKVHWRQVEGRTQVISGVKATFKGAVYFSINDKESLKIIYEYLYGNANYFLKRKHNKFIQAIA